ncbi:glycosyltransferase family 2 protein [Loigolactobacillus coryniformis subsp. coryniformis]|uniref:glycosyltransferase family 2 protein n=1 Tax=Loigolactobacillus coryniformis TaxID=1610 RepID=UPI0039917527
MDLSIIIPMYNASDYIDNCLTSIKQQTWLPDQFEIIIVDDGSTDDSRDLVNNWSTKLPIKLLVQENQKQAVARNKALDQATGQYILFVDSDDELAPDMIKHLYHGISGYSLVESGINKIFLDPTGNIVKREIEHPAIQTAASQNDLFKLYFGANTECDVGLWNKLFCHDIIMRNNLRFDNANFFEDSLFVGQYLRLIQYDQIKYIKQPLYNFYKRQASTTTSFHQEIDQLSSHYISKCAMLFEQTSLSTTERASLLAALKLRVWIYTIHHHIKYDPQWRPQKQRQYLLCKIGLKSSFKLDVPLKYRLAFWSMLCFTTMYNKLYRRQYLA